MKDMNDIHEAEWHSLDKIINTEISEHSVYS